MKKLNIEVGNFTCLFESKELIDCFEDRIWPLVKKNRTWPFGKGEDKNFVYLGFKIVKKESDYYVIGRIVRNMKLKSVQKYDKSTEQLRSRTKTMEDSPSVFFTLRLVDHKMVIIRETTRAPSLSQVEDFFKTSLKIHRAELKEKDLDAFKKFKKRRRLTQEMKSEFDLNFLEVYPFANFRITPVSSFAKASEAFDDVRSLKYLAITLLHTNNEDPEFRTSLVRSMTAQKKLIGKGGTTAVKTIIADNTVGLDKAHVIEVAQDVASSKGNATIVAKGENSKGVEVTINNHELSIKDTVELEDAQSEHLKTMAGIEKITQHAGVVNNTPEIAENRLKIEQIAARLGFQ